MTGLYVALGILKERSELIVIELVVPVDPPVVVMPQADGLLMQ